MRELIGSETKMVAAAGVVTDDPRVKEVLDKFDDFCLAAGTISSSATSMVGKGIDGAFLPTPGVGIANRVVNETVKVMDNAFTSVFQSIKNLFG